MRPHSAFEVHRSASASGLLERGELDGPNHDDVGQSTLFPHPPSLSPAPVSESHLIIMASPFPLFTAEKIFFDKDRALQLEHQRKMDYRRKLKSPHRLTPLDHVRELYEGAGYYLRCKRDLRPATAQPVLFPAPVPVPPRIAPLFPHSGAIAIFSPPAAC